MTNIVSHEGLGAQI